MRIHFHLPYKTFWGQRVVVTGNIQQLGNNDLQLALSLKYNYPEEWLGEIEVDASELLHLNYKYVLVNDQNGQVMEEWGMFRSVTYSDSQVDHIYCYDQWNAPNVLENTFMTAPFREVLMVDTHEIENVSVGNHVTHILKVKAPSVPANQVVCLVGDCDELGNWSTKHPVLLLKVNEEDWQVALNLSKVKADVHYKYGYFDIEDNRFCCFEEGADRLIKSQQLKKVQIQKHDAFVRIPVPKWRGAGVGLPVFSIRTRKSFGVGDFVDLKSLIDWAEMVGLKLIQVLPLNDTIGTHTDADVLPYAAITAFALNPLFLHLPAMGKLPASHPVQKEFKKKQKELNDKELIEFLDVINFKLLYAKELYMQDKAKFLSNKDFLQFFTDNEYWLRPYAAFCVLRDMNGTADYRKWKEYSDFQPEKIQAFTSEDMAHYDDVAVNYFIQYHLHLQLSDAHQYAHNHGVVLKGDIPIGVNRNSVDTWVNPELFNLNMQAGAPPDMFAVKGQNWELPTYNWEAIQKTNFDWWKKRFSQMSNYFDTFRIDHILGFFRIWQIPNHQEEGIMGHLQPSVPVHVNEFGEKGVWFDYNRFCKPYITDGILWDFFGEEMAWVKANCLQIEDGWVLRLKPEYQSQKDVDALFQEGKITEKVKWGLFDLISNVLFFEQEGSNGTQFYPRFGMQTLKTYRDLDENTKRKLDDIYVDYFFRRQDAHWYKSGMDKLPSLKRSTNMLICGEDLGMMTQCVTDVMNDLSILSLEVQRAPKTNSKEFFHPADAPYLSVVTPSTHDMSTVRGWWEEDRGVTQRFYNNELGHWGEAPYFCEWWICRDVLLQHLHSPAMWAVFQLQDLLGVSEKIRRSNPHDERINVPSNSKFSWRYRMHVNMEDLIDNEEFNAEIRNYIQQSGR